MAPRRLTRRHFLKVAGATGAVLLPAALAGYGAARSTDGEMPPRFSPYLPDGELSEFASTPLQSAPILILLDGRSSNPFGWYWSEIMRVEGLTSFVLAQLDGLNLLDLEQFNVILLAEQLLAPAEAQLLIDYVSQGGQLIAMRPDPQLAPLLGVAGAAGSIDSTYLQIDTAHPIGRGFTDMALQFHGLADRYQLAGAQAIAWLAGKDNRRDNYPAVTHHRYGRGQAAMWAFDLARSIALTRQGNPAQANQELDGFFHTRATDMFVDWVDLDRMAIPQADEQQRLLAKLLTSMCADRFPLPRLWYFPGAVDSVLVATSDAHQNPATAVEDIVARTERYGGHLSIYYLPPLYPTTRRLMQHMRWGLSAASVGGDSYFPAPAQITDWRARGHEYTLHPEVTQGLAEGWRIYWEGFTGLDWGPVSPTTRTHAVVWTGWVESARLQASYGIRLNHDYYHIGPMFRDKQGRWLSGYFTGSGLPMRFVDEQGRILDIFQQLTQLADDHLLKLHWNGVAELSAEEALSIARPLLERSLTDHSVVTMQFHTDPYAQPEPHYMQAVKWLEGSLDYARAKGIPIWDSLKWLQFWAARHAAALREFVWDSESKSLSFNANVKYEPGAELALMIPALHRDAVLSQVLIDGRPVQHYARELRGEQYRWVNLTGGKQRIEVEYRS